jgi:hypothetical protein
MELKLGFFTVRTSHISSETKDDSSIEPSFCGATSYTNTLIKLEGRFVQ